MASTTYPPQAIAANVESQFPWQIIPPRVQTAEVRISDPGGNWPASIDNTRHLKCWGLQIDVPGDPRWWLFEGDSFTSVFMNYAADDHDRPLPVPKTEAHPEWWLPFGLRLRDGSLPRVRLEGDIKAALRVRVAILSDAPISLGATITTVP